MELVYVKNKGKGVFKNIKEGYHLKTKAGYFPIIIHTESFIEKFNEDTEILEAEETMKGLITYNKEKRIER